MVTEVPAGNARAGSTNRTERSVLPTFGIRSVVADGRTLLAHPSVESGPVRLSRRAPFIPDDVSSSVGIALLETTDKEIHALGRGVLAQQGAPAIDGGWQPAHEDGI